MKVEHRSTWLHRLGAGACNIAARLHDAAAAALDAGWATSPLPRAPMTKVNTLPVGQFALLPEVIPDNDGHYIITESLLLVQGLAQDRRTNVMGCQGCVDLKCRPGTHAPMRYTTDRTGQPTLRVRRYALVDGRGFQRATADEYIVDVPNYFVRVRPRVYTIDGEVRLAPFADSGAEKRWLQEDAKLTDRI